MNSLKLVILFGSQATDVNTHILVSRGKKTPDSYKQSFSDLERKSGMNPAALIDYNYTYTYIYI